MYEELLNQGEYGLLYDNISKDSKDHISREEFIKRYSSIYSGIGAKNIEISVGEIKDKNIV